MDMERIRRARLWPAALGALLALSLAANAAQAARSRTLLAAQTAQRQRELADVAAAMADIEINLEKLLIASGAQQSAKLLGETALLAQHVETGLSRLPLGEDAAASAMKFAGQMERYGMALIAQVCGGRMLTAEDERQIEELLLACRALGGRLSELGEAAYAPPSRADGAGAQDGGLELGDSDIPYPSLIYDGPFSDGRSDGETKGLTGERFTRQMAREAAARYAGVDVSQVRDAADSGGRFEAFGFTAQTPDGPVSVQVTGQGGHLLWMMPERAEFEAALTREACLTRAKQWLSDVGFGEMEACFSQEYGGMTVANFAAVQDGVLLYPDQVKVQVSMRTGAVVGAECTQYLSHHERRELGEPAVALSQAREMLSTKLNVLSSRLCVIPEDDGERLCWGFEGELSGARYWVYVDALTGKSAQILRVIDTPDGEAAV